MMQVQSRRSPSLVDSLPESFPYRDDGCYVNAHCLQCPLPQCIYDNPGWLQQQQRRSRDLEVLQARDKNNLSVNEVAARFGISERTVFRIISRNRDYPGVNAPMPVGA